MRIDLHTHSTHSDGTEGPADVVASARAAGLDVVALTDHDTMSGWDEAGSAAVAHGITVVPGIEISCRAAGISVHLLAYLPDPRHAGLLAELEATRESRLTRASQMVDLLAADGVRITDEDVLAQAAPGTTLGRPHIADALVSLGVAPSRDAAFGDYLHAGSPYYVFHYAPDAVRAVELVVQAGGVPVMAHPLAGRRGRTVDDRVIAEMAEAGMAGLEVYHRDHDTAAVRHGTALAERLGLFVTGSSDYHGAGKHNVLGEHTTAPEVLDQILQRGSGAPVLRS